MSNWVRFSDRRPTIADADCDGKVVILYNNKRFGHIFLEMKEDEIKCGDFDYCHWLENVPQFPRTLEEVATELCRTGFDCDQRPGVRGLINEMREILREKRLNNQDS